MALSIGQQAPDFTLFSHTGEEVSLSALAGCAVALVFYPAAFTGRCTGELRELRDSIELFDDASVTLLAISCDHKGSLAAFAEAEGFTFTLLSDHWPHGDVARRYDAFIDETGVATRATYLIDAGGVIRAEFRTSPGEARDLGAYREALATLTA